MSHEVASDSDASNLLVSAPSNGDAERTLAAAAQPNATGKADLAATVARPTRRQARSGRGVPGEERYHVLLRNLRITGQHDSAPRAIGISRVPGGVATSVVATNFAWTLAQTVCQPVLLVAANPANRLIDDTFRGRERRRMTSIYAVLRDELPLDQAILATECEFLHVVPSGRSPVTAVDLAALQRFPNLLEDMRHNYEYIVFDLPSASELTSCYDLAASLDGVVIEIEAHRTRAAKAEKVVRELKSLGIVVLGAILKEM